jgi:hypothetical protein
MTHLFNKGVLLSGESNKLFNEVKDAYNDIKKTYKISDWKSNTNEKLIRYLHEILYNHKSDKIAHEQKKTIVDFFENNEIQKHKYIIYILFEYFLELNLNDKYSNLHELFYHIKPIEKNNMLNYLYDKLIYANTQGGSIKKKLKNYF